MLPAIPAFFAEMAGRLNVTDGPFLGLDEAAQLNNPVKPHRPGLLSLNDSPLALDSALTGNILCYTSEQGYASGY